MTAQRGKWTHEPDRYGDEDNRYQAELEEAALAASNRERETPSGWITAEEWRRVVPAARCRECGNVTWRLSLSGGPEKLVDSKKHGPVHKEGCSKPPGKLDLRYQ